MSKREYLFGSIIIFAVVFSLYLYTVAPTLSFWDCGEYIACAHSLGVPHPPGCPLHVLIRKIFTLIPFGKEIGFRANLLSVLSGAFSAAFIWLILVMVIQRIKKIETPTEKLIAWIGASVGSIVAAFSYTCWWNSMESEGYGISACILIFCLWLALKWDENQKNREHKKYLTLIAYLIALSAGIHLTPLLTVPGILLFMFLRNREEAKDPGILRFITLVLPFFALCVGAPLLLVFLLGALAIGFILSTSRTSSIDGRFYALTAFLLVLGFTTYGYLIIRARKNPRINEVAPTNMEKLWEGFTRKQYGPNQLSRVFNRQTQTKENGYNFFQAVGYQVKFFTDYLTWQWTPYPREERWERRTLSNFTRLASVTANTVFILLGIFGMWSHYKKERNTFFLIWITFFMASIGLLIYTNFKFSPTDPNPLHRPTEVRERHYFFGSAFLLFGLYIGFGIWSLLSTIKPRLRLPACALSLIALIPILGNFWSHANRRGLWVADDYGFNMLTTCDDGATVFTNGDNDTFPLWFAQEVKNIKPSVNVANLSLLNTDWHIKQLKQQGVPISFTDYEAENLIPFPVIKNGQADKTKLLLVKDLAVRDIIATNGGYKFKPKIFMPIKRKILPKKYRRRFPEKMELIPPSYYARRIPEEYWLRLPEEYFLPHEEFTKLIFKKPYKPKKPVYFAVTVSESNMQGYKPYLQMEGLAHRVVGIGATRFNIERSDSLLNKVYKYRSIFDPDVYKDKNTKRLLTNYAAAYFALGIAYKRQGEMDKAIEALEFGKKFKSEETLPFTYQLASLYEAIGEHEKAELNLRMFSEQANKAPGWYTLGSFYMRQGATEKAKQTFQRIIESNPDDPSLGYAGLIKTFHAQQDTLNLRKIFAMCAMHPKLASGILRILRAERRDELVDLLLENWLLYHPQDTVAQSLLKKLK